MKIIILPIIIMLSLVGCRKETATVTSSTDSQNVVSLPSVMLSLVDIDVTEKAANLTVAVTVSGIDESLVSKNKSCYIETISYLTYFKELSCDDLRWSGKRQVLTYLKNGDITDEFCISRFVLPHDSGIDLNKDKYLFVLVALKNDDKTFFKTWEMVEINWKENPNNRAIE